MLRVTGISMPGCREACNEKHMHVECLKLLLPDASTQPGSQAKPITQTPVFVHLPRDPSQSQCKPTESQKWKVLGPTAEQERHRLRPEWRSGLRMLRGKSILCRSLKCIGISVGFWPATLQPESKLFYD